MKKLMTLFAAAAVVSCAPVPTQNTSTPSVGPVSITPVSHTPGGMTEVMKFKALGKLVTATLSWRNYVTALDSGVSTWYGDMGRPPAKYVANELTVLIDGRPVGIPASKYRYLASQWMNDIKSLGVVKSGRNINIYVNVGDGSEGWVASYVINPSTGELISHEMHDGPSFHNQFL